MSISGYQTIFKIATSMALGTGLYYAHAYHAADEEDSIHSFAAHHGGNLLSLIIPEALPLLATEMKIITPERVNKVVWGTATILGVGIYVFGETKDLINLATIFTLSYITSQIAIPRLVGAVGACYHAIFSTSPKSLEPGDAWLPEGFPSTVEDAETGDCAREKPRVKPVVSPDTDPEDEGMPVNMLKRHSARENHSCSKRTLEEDNMPVTPILDGDKDPAGNRLWAITKLCDLSIQCNDRSDDVLFALINEVKNEDTWNYTNYPHPLHAIARYKKEVEGHLAFRLLAGKQPHEIWKTSDWDKKNMPIHTAAESGNMGVIEYLASEITEVNRPNNWQEIKNQEGLTPLQCLDGWWKKYGSTMSKMTHMQYYKTRVLLGGASLADVANQAASTARGVASSVGGAAAAAYSQISSTTTAEREAKTGKA